MNARGVRVAGLLSLAAAADETDQLMEQVLASFRTTVLRVVANQRLWGRRLDPLHPGLLLLKNVVLREERDNRSSSAARSGNRARNNNARRDGRARRGSRKRPAKEGGAGDGDGEGKGEGSDGSSDASDASNSGSGSDSDDGDAGMDEAVSDGANNNDTASRKTLTTGAVLAARWRVLESKFLQDCCLGDKVQLTSMSRASRVHLHPAAGRSTKHGQACCFTRSA